MPNDELAFTSNNHACNHTGFAFQLVENTSETLLRVSLGAEVELLNPKTFKSLADLGQRLTMF